MGTVWTRVAQKVKTTPRFFFVTPRQGVAFIPDMVARLAPYSHLVPGMFFGVRLVLVDYLVYVSIQATPMLLGQSGTNTQLVRPSIDYSISRTLSRRILCFIIS